MPSSLENIDPETAVREAEGMLLDLKQRRLQSEHAITAEQCTLIARKAIGKNQRTLALKLASMAIVHMYAAVQLEALIAQRVQAIANDDWYAILGIKPDATSEEIKETYRERMKLIHPDTTDILGGPIGNTSVYAGKLREAFELLMIPLRRAQYDAKRQQQT